LVPLHGERILWLVSALRPVSPHFSGVSVIFSVVSCI